MKEEYRVYDYELWGNEKDGYTVNNSYRTEEIVELEQNISNSELIQVLKKKGVIKKYSRNSSIYLYGDEEVIYIDYKFSPSFELRKEKKNEV